MVPAQRGGDPAAIGVNEGAPFRGIADPEEQETGGRITADEILEDVALDVCEVEILCHQTTPEIVPGFCVGRSRLVSSTRLRKARNASERSGADGFCCAIAN